MTTFIFFSSTNLIFRAIPKHCFDPISAKFCGKFLKKQSKAVFETFLKNFDQKIAFFFGARSPSKLVYIGANGAFRKILGSVGQKWISEKVSKGDPLGRQGVESLKGGVRPPPSFPLNPPLITYFFQSLLFFRFS